MVVPREPPKKERIRKILNHGGENRKRTQRLLKSVLRAHHFIANILSKSSVPVYCLFVSFSFYGNFLHLLILCLCSLQGTETGSKDEHSKNKWQNINCLKQQSFMHAITTLCF